MNNVVDLVEHRQIQSMYGVAPSWDNVSNIDEDFNTKYVSAMNWANIMFSPTQLKGFVSTYLVQNNLEIDNFDSIPEFHFTTLGKVCWMITQGCPVREESIKWMDEQLAYIVKISGNYQPAEIIPINRVTKVELKRLQNSRLLDHMIGTVENSIDALELSGETFNCYEYLVGINADLVSSEALGAHLNQQIVSLNTEVRNLSGLSQQDIEMEFDTLECFGKYKDNIMARCDILRTVIQQLRGYIANERALRKNSGTIKGSKMRQQRIKKQLKDVQFKTSDNTFNLTSIPPVSVLGSQMLIVFNTKTKKIGVYLAKDEQGLDIQGTTISNFCEEDSFQRTIRDTDKILQQIQSCNIHRLRVLMNDHVTTKSVPITGRLNEHVVLIRSFKADRLTNCT